MRGFSLIELLLSMAIFILLGTFSSLFFSRMLAERNKLNAVDEIVGALRKAQMYAITGKKGSSWGVYVTPSDITLFSGNSYATRNTALDEHSPLSSSVSVSGISEIQFLKITGTPQTTFSATVTANGSQKSITMNAIGVVSAQ